MRNLPFLIDHEGRPVCDASLWHQNAVGFRRFTSCEIAEEGKRKGKLLGKFTLGWNIIGADSEDLRISALKLGDTSLVSREFLRSATGESGREEGYHHILLAAIIGELHLLATGLRGRQFKIRRHVTDLEMSLRRRRLRY
jgi:hypothetical protein